MRGRVQKLNVKLISLSVVFLFLLAGRAQAGIIEYTVTGDFACSKCFNEDINFDGAHYVAVYRFDASVGPYYSQVGSGSSYALYDATSVQITISNSSSSALLELTLDSAKGNAHNNHSIPPSEDGFGIQINYVTIDSVNVTFPRPDAHFDNSYYGVKEVPALPIFDDDDVVGSYYSVLYVGSDRYTLENGTFEVTSAPSDPIQAMQELVSEVIKLNLGQGIQNSLDGKLDSAISALEDVNENNDVAAVNKLEAFIAHVDAQRGHMIPESAAARLIRIAQQIILILETEY